jgi:hypothetical protein
MRPPPACFTAKHSKKDGFKEHRLGLHTQYLRGPMGPVRERIPEVGM